MNTKVFFLCASLMFVLGACGPTTHEAEQERHLQAKADAINVTFNDKAVAKDVIGFRATSITAISEKSGGGGSAAQGTTKRLSLSCKLTGSGFSAEFETPAVLNLPSLGKNSKSVKVDCSYKDKMISETYKAVNLSKTSRDGAVLAVGIVVCPICGVVGALANGGEQDSDVYGYDRMEIAVK